MDPTGNLKKVNRYVLRAVSKLTDNPKKKLTLKEICKHVKFLNRNRIPISDLEHSVQTALYNLEKHGLIIRNLNNSFQFCDVGGSSNNFQSTTSRVKSKRKYYNPEMKKLRTSRLRQKNVNLSVKPSELPLVISRSRSRSRSRNLLPVKIDHKLNSSLNMNSRKRKLSPDDVNNNQRSAKISKLIKHENIRNSRRKRRPHVLEPTDAFFSSSRTADASRPSYISNRNSYADIEYYNGDYEDYSDGQPEGNSSRIFYAIDYGNHHENETSGSEETEKSVGEEEEVQAITEDNEHDNDGNQTDENENVDKEEEEEEEAEEEEGKNEIVKEDDTNNENIMVGEHNKFGNDKKSDDDVNEKTSHD